MATTNPRVSEPAPTTESRKRYHVIAKLGEGGMALVHLAVVLGVGGVRKLVVLKSIRPELVADSRMREMFLSEARLAATLNHPNIVQTFEVVVFARQPVLVMEYLDGQSLSRILHRERRDLVPLEVQLYVLREVLNGLDYVHSLTDLDGTPLNLVHRDISPPNIFVTYDGQVKILDFGIAKNIASSANTETGVIKGKIRYMAPEQFVGATNLDRRADIFAVGVLLWEALTGKRLWEGLPDVQIMQNLVSGEVPAPRTVAGNVFPALEAICKKALSRNSNDRYESAAAMQADLEAATDEAGLGATRRHVGKLVSDVFAERRSKTKLVIEQQLREEEASAVSFVISDESDADATDDAAVNADLWGLPTEIGSTRPVAAQRWRRLVPVASFTAALVAGLMILFGTLARSRHERGASAVPAAAAALPPRPPLTPGPPSSAAAGSVWLTVRATPSRARLLLDDVLLPGNPYGGPVPSDPGHHALRVEASGYRSQTLSVTLAAPLALNVDLQPIGAASTFDRAAAARTPPPPAVSAASAPATPAPRTCKPPFYFDERGIKLYRPECLR